MRPFLAVPILGLLTLAAMTAQAGEPSWHYVVPKAGDPHEHPPLRAVALTADKPEGLKETARYRGRRRLYAQFRYGSSGSGRVTIVVDEVSTTQADLYIDAARANIIGPDDRVAGSGGSWRVTLDAAFVEGARLETTRRTLLIRYGRASRTLALATCGFLEGKVRLGDRTFAARRMDGDANGLFTDLQDRLWIDLDGDGRFDPFDEQFPFAPILTLAGVRWAVHSDPLGRRLGLERLEGSGSMRLALAPPLADLAEDLEATLAGRDGSVFTLAGRGADALLPIGDYRLSVVSLRLRDPSGGPVWSFLFSDNGSDRPHRWHTVVKDGCCILDPVGKVDFSTGFDANASCRAGDQLSVGLGLFTGDGLLINTMYRGVHAPMFQHDSGAEVVVTDASGKELCRQGVGFA
jgi:hypothetical protein